MDEDFKLVEAAGFTYQIKLAATTTIAALHYLRELAKESGVAMEEITAEQILKKFSEADAAILKNQSAMDEFLADRARQENLRQGK